MIVDKPNVDRNRGACRYRTRGLLALPLLAAASPQPTTAEWATVTESESGAVTYVDPGTVTTKDGVTYAWELWDFDADPDEPESKSVRRMGNRCSTRERASFEEVTFDQKGKVLERHRFSVPDWSKVTPDSVGDALLIAACAIEASRFKERV